MLPEAKLKQLQDLIASSTKEELIWINGYLNGVVANNNPVAATTNTIKKITLLFGTETGNSKSLAIQFAALAKKHSIVAKVAGVDQYRLTDLPKEENLFIVISTHGEGEPPESAKKFYDYIHQNELSLSNTKFSVLALGDTSYPIFCKTGEDVDAQLEKFGAKRIVPIQKCDVDYEAEAKQWFNKVLNYLEQSTNTIVKQSITVAAIVPAKKVGKKIYDGTIVTNINLHDRGSNKETYHIEITTEETIEFEAGDALAIIPNNKDFIVDTLLALTATNPSTEVVTAKHTATARELLLNHLNICYLLTSTIKKYAAIVGKEIPEQRVDLINLIKDYPVKNAEQFVEVIKILSPIAPRLYTISSSPVVNNTEVHITVRRDEFISHEDKRYGLCSNFLGDAYVDTKINFYIHKNKHFKLPTADKDIIMIGPGTGIAPFRSFLQERDATGAVGKNWLFFGEHHFQKDFLYQTELQNHLQTEVLHNISLAFSRDQAEKIYVQHKMLEKGNELFSWVEKGATIYLSGTKGQMNTDVENALLQVIEQHGNKTEEEAKAYWEQLKKEGRYQKEVY